MADINHIISLGIGSPAAIQEFLTFGLQQGAADTTPDAFSFVDQTNVALSTQITSAAITVAGINSPADITVTGGTYSVNGGAFTAAPGTVNNGDTVTARHTSSAALSTATDTVVTIGGVSDTFTSTTTSVAASEASGGWFFEFESHRERRRKRQQELDDAEEEAEKLQNKIDREIAQLLHEQERKDEKRKDLERIKSLVKRYESVTPAEISSERVLKALAEAKKKATTANLERLQREFERMCQEEDDFLALVMILANE